MAKQNFGSMVKEAERQMTRGMKPMMSGKMPMMNDMMGKKRKMPPAYGRGGKKGRHQYGKTIKGYADPLA